MKAEKGEEGENNRRGTGDELGRKVEGKRET